MALRPDIAHPHRYQVLLNEKKVFLIGDVCRGSSVWNKALRGKVRQEAVIRNVYRYFAEATNVEGRLTDVRSCVMCKQVFSQMEQGIHGGLGLEAPKQEG